MRTLKQIQLRMGLCLLSALLISAFANAGTNKGTTIKIESMQFSPASFHVKKGEKVIYINNDLVPHTVTADDKSFDSKTIEAGKSWTFRADKVGVHPFKCSFHPTMTGTISVD